jgi:hypothetical protein
LKRRALKDKFYERNDVGSRGAAFIHRYGENENNPSLKFTEYFIHNTIIYEVDLPMSPKKLCTDDICVRELRLMSSIP